MCNSNSYRFLCLPESERQGGRKTHQINQLQLVLLVILIGFFYCVLCVVCVFACVDVHVCKQVKSKYKFDFFAAVVIVVVVVVVVIVHVVTNFKSFNYYNSEDYGIMPLFFFLFTVLYEWVCV